MQPVEIFRTSLVLIDSVVACVCRGLRMQPSDVEDFGSDFKLALIENDYAILRSYQGRSTLGTYLTAIAHRLLVNEQRTRGRWHPSAAATQMGEAGLLLERAVRRDQRTIDEVLPLLQAIDPSLSRIDVDAMEAKLPQRGPRPHVVALDPLGDTLPGGPAADATTLDAEALRLSQRIGDVVRQSLAELSLEDRTIVRLHFGASMSIADISRMLRLPQRPLYRRLERALEQIRLALQDERVDVSSVTELIGSAVEFDFGLIPRESDPAWPTDGLQEIAMGQKGSGVS
ncbi:MAG TPA: sigma-70 family RNA polymerase sigma factor [Thermoanaerobaculia bacterium]|jgi:RNA polymerase sigma factor for flagellar operon FliA|nr:sigma-70 family RNA polymerase sigma factor [Thermoanaerobaculia bacterium]